jgi:hypothetical protein
LLTHHVDGVVARRSEAAGDHGVGLALVERPLRGQKEASEAAAGCQEGRRGREGGREGVEPPKATKWPMGFPRAARFSRSFPAALRTGDDGGGQV